MVRNSLKNLTLTRLQDYTRLTEKKVYCGVMVSAFVSRSSGLGLSTSWGHCVVFL